MVRATQRVGKESPPVPNTARRGQARGLRTGKVVPSTYTGFLYYTALTLTKRWSKSLLPIQNQAQQNDNFFFSGIKHCHCHFWWRNLDPSCDSRECSHTGWAVLPIKSLLSSDSSSSDFHNRNQTTISSFSFCQQMHDKLLFSLNAYQTGKSAKEICRQGQERCPRRKEGQQSVYFFSCEDQTWTGRLQGPHPSLSLWHMGSWLYGL